MFIVIMAMFVTSMFVAAGVRRGQRRPAASRSRPRTASRPTRRPRPAWTSTSTTSSENPDVLDASATGAGARTRPRTTRSTSSGTAAATDPRVWRKIPGVDAEYTIELLHHARLHQVRADTTKQESVIDMSSGTFKIRVTGRATSADAAKRSIIVTFRRDGFLKFVYFTDQENRDPQAAHERQRRAPRSRPTASTSTARRAPARAARRSSSPPATRSTARCTPTTRAS